MNKERELSKQSSLLDALMRNLHDDFLPKTSKIPGNISYIMQKSFRSIKTKKRHKMVIEHIDCAIDILWEDLNVGHWKDIPEINRRLYSIFSYLKVLALLQMDLKVNTLKEALKTADLGLLLGSACREELSQAASLINNICTETLERVTPATISECKESLTNFDYLHKTDIFELDCPSLEYFNKHYFYPELPVKLTNCISHWPALTKWRDMNYIRNVAGFRTVPIELGSSYTNEEWGMKLFTLQEFIENHIYNSNSKLGYLAQHQLFDQVPELRRDISVPEYCCLSKDEGSVCDPDINAWFGPSGTVTPLHYDPKHNLLSQVIGRKKILLYSPEDSINLYPHETDMLHNTARVDPQNPDYRTYPRYKLAMGVECLLNPVASSNFSWSCQLLFQKARKWEPIAPSPSKSYTFNF